MGHDERLGYFDPTGGGYIRLHMGSTSDTDIAASTAIHENFHGVLFRTTTLGQVMGLMQYEITLSRQNKAHTKRMETLYAALFHRTNYVHEVYANNMELFALAKDQGLAKANYAFVEKSPDYFKYFVALKPINSNLSMENEEKMRLTSRLCHYALNIDVSKSEFISSLESPETLARYLDHYENDPSFRLESGLMQLFHLRNEDVLTYDFSSSIKSFIRNAYESELFIYSRETLKKILNDFENPPPKFDPGFFCTLEDMAFSLNEKNVVVFNLDRIRTQYIPFSQGAVDYPHVIIRNTTALKSPDNFFLLSYVEDVHTGLEITPNELIAYLHNAPFIAVLLHEYNVKTEQPLYFWADPIPLFIIIDNYQDCESLMCHLLERNELIIGDLYGGGIESHYTFIFFRSVDCADNIFVFPTTKQLAAKLFAAVELAKPVCLPNDEKFIEIFETFSYSKENLKIAIRWVVELISL